MNQGYQATEAQHTFIAIFQAAMAGGSPALVAK